MLNDIRPFLTEQVQHGQGATRDLFGKVTDHTGTQHAARVVEVQGGLPAPASSERIVDATATIWLLNHPRIIRTGDTFTLPSGRTLAVRRVEYRTDGSNTLSKALLT